ncbi:MAG: copper resistance protein CopC [Pseudonocardiaceae bacterium]
MRRLVGVVAGVLALVLAAAPPAAAHPTLLFTTPTADTAVAEPPTSITLLFSEPVTTGDDDVAVSDATGAEQPVGRVSPGRGGAAVVAELPRAPSAGTYTVRWRVTGADGDIVEDEFRFAVGAALSGSGEDGSGAGVSWAAAALRWVLFAGLALALGGLAAGRVVATARAENPALPPVRSWSAFGAVAALAATTGLAALLIGDAGTAAVMWEDRPGQLLAAEAAGLTAALALLAVRHGDWAVLPLLTVTAAEGLRSHAGVAEPGWGALLTAVHLAVAAVWVGALVHTVRAAVRWRTWHAAVRWTVSEYARVALWLFLAVVATGTVTALILVPAPALTTTTYGVVLLVKLALVAVAAGLALAARLSLRRRLARVRWLARAESTVLVGVLAVAATLVSAPLPRDAAAPATPPPEPVGAVLPLGARAGQVGVSMAASDGQLVVRLATPRRGDYYEQAQPQDYRLSGRLDPPSGRGQILRFRPCGEGCFVAAAPWGAGDNALTLLVSAVGWRGGTVGALIPWPVQPAADLLARTVETMRSVEVFTLYETVTSDTTMAVPDPRPLALTAGTFLDSVPYGSGVAPEAAQLFRTGEPVRLWVAFPAAGQAARLVLDDRGRIAEETLTTEKHLVRHRFVYQDSS